MSSEVLFFERMTSKRKKQTVKDTEPDGPATELGLKMWSVVTFDGCEASGMTYDEAVKLMSLLQQKENVAGLCIVTDDAAERRGN